MQSAKSMRLETPAAQNLQPEIQFVHQARAVLVHQGRQLGHATSFASMFGRFEINSSRGVDESWWMFMVFIIMVLYGFAGKKGRNIGVPLRQAHLHHHATKKKW